MIHEKSKCYTFHVLRLAHVGPIPTAYTTPNHTRENNAVSLTILLAYDHPQLF